MTARRPLVLAAAVLAATVVLLIPAVASAAPAARVASGPVRVTASADATAPSVPIAQAWLNGRGFVRVSWRPSVDRGSGLGGYVVRRSVSGGSKSVVATVPASAGYWDDNDPAVAPIAAVVAYDVTAFDRAGNVSARSHPATRGIDLIAPPAPSDLFAYPYNPGEGPFFYPWAPPTGLSFAAYCRSVTDTQSGVADYEFSYGPSKDVRVGATYGVGAGYYSVAIITSDQEYADWWFTARAEDRAGNVSTEAAGVEQREISVDRVAGADRIGTAIAVSKDVFSSSRYAVVASAWSSADGLAASSLAGALKAPVLLVGSGAVRSDVATELARLGVTDAYVVGGPSAVSAETFDSLKALVSGEVTRVAGGDRYGTAAAVATTLRGIAGRPPGGVFLVLGSSFADAIDAGPIAYAHGWPILFATSTSVPKVTLDAIASIGATRTAVLGKVWPRAGRVVPPITFWAVGTDRYATSDLVAEWAFRSRLLGAARPVFVTGNDFPDGLTAASLAGSRNAPVLLVRPRPLRYPVPWLPTFIQTHVKDLRRVTAVGGPGAVNGFLLYEAWYSVQLPLTRGVVMMRGAGPASAERPPLPRPVAALLASPPKASRTRP